MAVSVFNCDGRLTDTAESLQGRGKGSLGTTAMTRLPVPWSCRFQSSARTSSRPVKFLLRRGSWRAGHRGRLVGSDVADQLSAVRAVDGGIREPDARTGAMR